MRRFLVTDFTAESETAEPYPLRVLATEMRSASVVQTPAALETAMINTKEKLPCQLLQTQYQQQQRKR